MGHALALARDPLGFLARVRDEDGDLVRLELGRRPAWVAFAPGLIRAVLIDDHDSYDKHTPGARELIELFGVSLGTASGDDWKFRRRVLQPLFRRARVAAAEPAMLEATGHVASDMERDARRGEPTDLHAAMKRLAFDVVSRSLVRTELRAERESTMRAHDFLVRDIIRRAALQIPLWLPTIGNLRARRARAIIDTNLRRIMARDGVEKTDGDPTSASDLLSALRTARDPETGRSMTEREVLDELMGLVFAGHGTLASALTFTLALIAAHPAIRARILGEIDSVLGGRTPTLADLPALDLTSMAIHEGLRLYPPLWLIPRRVVRPTTLGGHALAPGALVLLSPWVTHRHPDLWSRPDTFDPERFRGGPPRDQSWFPFSAGPRLCVGRDLALIAATLVTAGLLQRVEPILPHGAAIVPRARVALEPSRPILVHSKRRT